MEERDGVGVGKVARDETKTLLVTTSTWEALPSQSACLSHLFLQGVVGGADRGSAPGFRASGLRGMAVRKNREDILMEWQPPRVGFLAAICICGPHVGSCGPAAAAAVTAYFGVSHSGRVRSCLQQSKPPSRRQCLPRPLRHWLRHHPVSPCTLGPQPFGCGAVASHLGPSDHPSESKTLTPESTFPGAPVPWGLAPWLQPSSLGVHQPPLQVFPFPGVSEPQGGSRGENFVSERGTPG